MKKSNPELAVRLALLADEVPNFEGGLRTLSGRASFETILHLIDQTVIPAILEIHSGERVFLVESSGRRICRLPGVIEDLTASDTASLANAARHIADFAESADGPLRVRELPSEDSNLDPAQSVSIRAVAAAVGRPLIDPNMPPIAQVRVRLGVAVTAAIILEAGKVVEQTGDAGLCAQLKQNQKALTALVAGDAPRLIFCELDDDKPAARGIISVQDNAIIFATQGINSAQIMAAYDQSING